MHGMGVRTNADAVKGMKNVDGKPVRDGKLSYVS